MPTRTALLLSAITATATTIATVAGLTTAAGASAAASAQPDTYRVPAGQVLTVRHTGVLANDTGGVDTVVSHTAPAHGTLDLAADGSFRYTPAAGFVGTDTFTYATTPAVHLYRTDLPPLATIGGVAITAGAYGSALAPAPGTTDQFYGLTDRGPNADGPDGTKVEPLPNFTPAIGKFRFAHGQAILQKTIALHAADGTPFDGHTNCAANTGETITDLDGNTLPCSDTGYDSEGLVAAPDGTFWISDEYGPFITHFDSTGKQIGRLSPFDHSLPRELANRVPNKGMEGLSLTPDGHTLVGIMQSALQQPDLSAKPAKVAPLRIVTVDLRTLAMHEYLYLLDDPATNSGAVSEITALSATRFLVDERDGKVEPGAYKKLFTIDLAGATDVGPAASVPGASYDSARGGLLIGATAQTVEAYVGADDTAAASAALSTAHVTAVTKSLTLDLGGYLTQLDPTGGFFGHDKVEGVATLNRGGTIVVSNDSDFGIDGLSNETPPFELHAKILPNGLEDDGEYLSIDTRRLQDDPSTATVTIEVRPARK